MDAITLDWRLAPLAALAAAMLVAVLRTPSARPTGPEAGPWLAFCLLVWSGMASQALTSGPGKALAVLGVLALALTAVRRMAQRTRDSAPPGHGGATSAPVLALLAVAWMAVVDVLATRSGVQRLVADVASLALLAAVVVLVRRGGLDRAWPATASLVGLTGLVGLSGLLGTAWAACHDDKCTPFGALLAGPYHSENLLALYAAFTMAAVLAGWSGRLRLLGVAYCVTLVAYTASRTSLLVVVAVLAAAVVAHRGAAAAQRRSGGSAPRRTGSAARQRGSSRAGRRSPGTAPAVPLARLVAFVPVVTVGLGLGLVLTADPQTLTGRGLVWLRARAALEGHWPTGVGLSRYEELQGVGLLSHHFTHSEYLLLAFSGGLVAVCLFTLALTAALRSSVGSAGSAMAALPGVALLLLGLTEVVWNPLTVDGLSWLPVAVLLTAGRSRPVDQPTEAAAGEALTPAPVLVGAVGSRPAPTG